MKTIRFFLIIFLVQMPIKITFAQTMRMAPPPPPPPPRSKAAASQRDAELIKTQRDEIKKLKEENAKLRALLKSQGKSVAAPANTVSVTATDSQTTIPESSKPIQTTKPVVEKVTAVKKAQPLEESKTHREDKLKVATKTAPLKKQALKKTNRKKRKTASTAFKSGMHRFRKSCQMFSKPSKQSSAMGTVKAGRKLWIDGHNTNWRKAYKKSGTVYVHKDCL